MKVNLQRVFAIALFAASTLAGGGRAVAQTPAVVADVPFEFTVGGRLLPADTYTITSTQQGVILIESADKRFHVQTTASKTDQQSERGSELVFLNYGGKRFLHEVLDPEVAGLNVDVPKSKLEKTVEVQEAKYGGAPEVVLVASR
jgi:hypothetical protein